MQRARLDVDTLCPCSLIYDCYLAASNGPYGLISQDLTFVRRITVISSFGDLQPSEQSLHVRHAHGRDYIPVKKCVDHGSCAMSAVDETVR